MPNINIQKIKKTAIEYESIILQILSIYIDAHKFVRNNNLRKYLLVSGIVFLLVFTVTIKAIIYWVNYIENPITIKLLPILQEFLKLNPEDISKGIKAAFWLIKKAIESNKDAIFSTVFLVIGTPFFSYISYKTEEIISGNKYHFSWSIFVKEIQRGISISIRNSIKQFGLILIITLFALIPIIDMAAPLLIFVVQVYYNGILMTDYTLERQGFSVKRSDYFYKMHKPEMFAIGLGFMFILLIPVIGWFIAPTYGLVASYLQFSNLNLKDKE